MTQNKNNLRSPEERYKKEIKQSVLQSNNISTNKNIIKTKPNRGKFFWIVFILIILLFALWAVISNEQANRENERKLKFLQQLDSTTYEEVSPEEFKTVIEDSLKLEAEINAKVESMAIAEKSGKTAQEKADEPLIPTTAVAEKPVKTAPAATVKSAPSKAQPVISQPGSVAKPQVKPLVKTEVKPAVKTEVAKSLKPEPQTSGEVLPVTITLGKSETLTQYSLKYYGHKAFWVYIYAANKSVIPDPNHIPLGTIIRIPKPDPSRINANDPNCIAKAKALQTKILSGE